MNLAGTALKNRDPMVYAVPLKISPPSKFCIEKTPGPCALIIFGASGDLTKRKLLPSILHLKTLDLLPKKFYVLGVARTQMSDDQFIDRTLGESNLELAKLSFRDCIYYVSGSYEDAVLYQNLLERLNNLDTQYGVKGRHLFYLSTPPDLYGPILERLSASGLVQKRNSENPSQFVIVEKPFGRDLRSAQNLNRQFHLLLGEPQLFRIDHYLGKESVQNILLFRFANTIFEPIWNREYIDHIQITVAESVGVEHRAGYYDRSGALRDMFQNHILQLLALITMDRPSSFEPCEIRKARSAILSCLKPITEMDVGSRVVRGQYREGVIDGQNVCAYRAESGVPKDSVTETYAAMRIDVDHERWAGVPIYCRTGKRLKNRISEISIQFKHIPQSPFTGIRPEDFDPNVLSLRIQPEEGITLTFQTKQPGPKLCMSNLTMNFSYREAFGIEPPEAYERLLLDAMLGDQTLFVSEKDVECAWAFLSPILQNWSTKHPVHTPHYDAGSWGPKEADRLLEQDGRSWKSWDG